jgi:hypothetical protein
MPEALPPKRRGLFQILNLISGLKPGAIDVSIKTNYKDNIEYNPSKKQAAKRFLPQQPVLKISY